MQSLDGREFGPLNWENACFSRFAEAIEMTAIHHPMIAAHDAERLASPFVNQGLLARPGDVAGRVSGSEDRFDRRICHFEQQFFGGDFPAHGLQYGVKQRDADFPAEVVRRVENGNSACNHRARRWNLRP